MFFSELKNKSGVASISTIKSRLDNLKKANFIQDEMEEKTSDGKYVGVKRYIWLTPMGKSIAEKLIEIEEILEKEKIT